MKNKGFLFIIGSLCLLALGVMGQVTNAASPLGFAAGFFKGGDKVEADPKKEYTITEENGPWMICVMTYSGENAKNQAMELAYELRKRYKMKAYVYLKEFDHTKGVSDFETMANSPVRKKVAIGNVTQDWAVLVGDFQSFADNDINDALKKLKSNAVSPDCLKRKSNGTGSGSVGEIVKSFRRDAREAANNNIAPLACSFKTTNPILPPDYFGEQKKFMDDFIYRMNSKTPYSILQCRGRYTIMVAQFAGNVYINPSKIAEIESGKNDIVKESKLEVAADNAERVCAELRKQGWTAFTFHDRNASIVTVGEFNHLGEQLPNGFTNYTDEIAHIIKKLGGKPSPKSYLAEDQTSYAVQSVAGIPLMTQPIPIETPRQRTKQAMR